MSAPYNHLKISVPQCGDHQTETPSPVNRIENVSDETNTVSNRFGSLRCSGALACSLFAFSSIAAAQARQPFDTLVYSDVATAELVHLARARHQTRSLELAGYRARVHTLVEGRIAMSRFGPGATVFRYETAARLHWARSHDVRVDIEGARMASMRMPGFGREQAASFYEDIFGSEPWFIPSSLEDRIEIMGLPDRDALHPLARDADRFYHYEISDSLSVANADRTVRVIIIAVEPRDPPDLENLQGFSWDNERRGRNRQLDLPTLVVGRLWVDADSLDVVRLTASFVGDGIWEEEDDTPQLVRLEADMEYSLHQNRYWLPLRQILSLNWVFKYLPGADMPGEAVTTFSDFELDLAQSEVAFKQPPLPPGTTGDRFGSWDCPDAWEFDRRRNNTGRCGARPTSMVGTTHDGTKWEINLPTLDSLESYDFAGEWDNDTERSGRLVTSRLAELASVSETDAARQTLRQRFANEKWRHAYDLVRYNRVQGTALGGGFDFLLWPAFTTLRLEARYGFGDERLVGAGSWRRDAPDGRLDITAYRAVHDMEPWTDGTGLGNSFKALVLGHDDADYYLAAFGARVRYQARTGWFRNGRVELAYERQQSMRNQNSATFGRSFQPNPLIADGDYVRAALAKTWTIGFAASTRVTLGADGLFSRDSLSTRFWGAVRLPYSYRKVIAALDVRGGVVAGSNLPQTRFRVGGPQTVRGYVYGVAHGRSFWSAQGDLELTASQWWSPLVFVDVGNVDFTGTPLVGVGTGVSLLSGWLKAELAKGVTHDGILRFDIYAQLPMN